MKIALLGPTSPSNNAIARYTTLLCAHLKMSHEVELFPLAPPHRAGRPGASQAPSNAKQHAALNPLNPISWLRTVKRLRRFEPDLLLLPWHSLHWAPQFFLVCSLVKLRACARVAYLCHHVHSGESSLPARLCTRLAFRVADAFLLHSVEDDRKLQAMQPSKPRIRVHYPNCGTFTPTGITRSVARAALSVAGNVVLFFGFARPYQGLEDFLQAMPLILQQTDVTLLVVGEFWKKEEELRTLAKRLHVRNNVIFHVRYVPNNEVEIYFAAADLVVLPSVSATAGEIAQIAYAMRKPVMGTRIGALPELIEHGQTGYLVDAQNPGAICDAVVDFFLEKRARQMEPSLAQMPDKFSWVHLVSAIEQLAAQIRGKELPAAQGAAQ